MPYPKKGEKRQDYVSRAIPMIHDEHPGWTQKHIIGSAYGRYDYYRKHQKKTLKDYAKGN